MKRSSSPALPLGSIAFVLVMASLFVAPGCGGAPVANLTADTKVGMAPEAPPPHNLGEAEAQFANAERAVFGAFGQNKFEAQGAFAQPPPGQAQATKSPIAPSATATEASPPAPPADDSRHDRKEGEDKAAARMPTGTAGAAAEADMAGVSSSPCETACRALASMNRSAAHICALAGDDSDSCNNARERVRAATERVRQSCSECASG